MDHFICMNLLTGDRYDYLYPLHFSISCHWSNSLEWKLVKRPFRIHEPECLNLFYFEHIWCVLLRRKFISTLARKRSFRGKSLHSLKKYKWLLGGGFNLQDTTEFIWFIWIQCSWISKNVFGLTQNAIQNAKRIMYGWLGIVFQQMFIVLVITEDVLSFSTPWSQASQRQDR